MTTGYEVRMYADIDAIAQALNRIANCLEANEKRARAQELVPYSSLLSVEDNKVLQKVYRSLLATTQKATTPEDIEQIGAAVQAVKRGFADMEKSVQEDQDG
jgi:xanthine dehydrogenase molybdopterin-binding subunit B